MQPLTPPAVDRVVRRCLAKVPDDRWASAPDIADELRRISQTQARIVGTPSVRRARWRTVGIAAALVVVTVIATEVVLWRFRPAPAPPRSVARLNLTLPPGVELYRGANPAAVLSPDGSRVAFVGVRGSAERQLYVRPLDQFEASPIPSTAGTFLNSCFFSPDGRSVGFVSADSVSRKVRLSDGLVETVARDVSGSAGGAWGADGRMTFGRAGALWQVDAEPGGVPRQVTTLDAQNAKGADPRDTLPNGQTLLHMNAWVGPPEAVALFVSRGADVNAAAKNGQTPLLIACTAGNATIAAALLDRGADPNVRDTAGRRPLEAAVATGQSGLVKRLLEAGAKPAEAVTTDKRSALHLAAARGRLDIAKMLLAAGADRAARDSQGRTPLDLAVRYGNRRVADTLRGASAPAAAS